LHVEKNDYTGKKRLSFFPSLAGMSLTRLSLAVNYQVLPGRESLVSVIPVGTGKTITFFYIVLEREGMEVAIITV
jgi:hypothetical protein